MSTDPLLGPPPPGQPGSPSPAYGGTAGAASGPLPAPTYQGEVPNEDVAESAAGQGPPQPSAPPLTDMAQVSGYENIGFQPGTFIPPPSYQEAITPRQEQASDIHANIPTVSEEEARAALLEEVSTHCCYGSGAAKDLVITKISPSSAFHYQLESFTEGRKTSWEYEPYIGQLIDGPQNGPAPSPWDIQVQPNREFEDHMKHFEVPHTSSVKLCHNCNGLGMDRCWRCMGRGGVTCGNCNGSGHILTPVVHHDHGHHHHGHHHHGHHHHGHHHHGSHIDMERTFCYHCNGTGRKRCWTCNGYGQIECTVCLAKKQLKCYIKLTVTWKTTKSDHVVERTALPDHLIRSAQGKLAFSDQQPRVAPVTHFPDTAVNSASHELVQSHAVAFPSERILLQRHWIRVVPVSEVQCAWKGDHFTFWVFGHDNQVYNPDYPQQQCWGCTLL